MAATAQEIIDFGNMAISGFVFDFLRAFWAFLDQADLVPRHFMTVRRNWQDTCVLRRSERVAPDMRGSSAARCRQ
tara:strand:+ start:1661 stop:1885 length:225 start_codon:yes stop_codon:yes gene_type:complete